MAVRGGPPRVLRGGPLPCRGGPAWSSLQGPTGPFLTSPQGSTPHRSRPVTMTAPRVSAGHTAPASPPAGLPRSADPPQLADGVELLGEYRDSGYSQPPSLVRRPDGQVIQMSPLLYRVTCRIDGSRDAAAIADLASSDLGRLLTAEQVRHLVTTKLQPLGIIATQGTTAAPPRARPLLALRARARCCRSAPRTPSRCCCGRCSGGRS